MLTGLVLGSQLGIKAHEFDCSCVSVCLNKAISVPPASFACVGFYFWGCYFSLSVHLPPCLSSPFSFTSTLHKASLTVSVLINPTFTQLKRLFTQKWQFTHPDVANKPMTFFLRCNTKEDILENVFVFIYLKHSYKYFLLCSSK